MADIEHCRVRPDLDVWLVPNFDETILKCPADGLNARNVQARLEQGYPVRHAGDAIGWATPQWIEGDNAALKYRGNTLKRGKMWFQIGEPRDVGFTKYYYTGWQNAVLPATSNVETCPELAPLVAKYNDWCAGGRFAKANHFIATHYSHGEQSIGDHYDKPKSIQRGSLITILKTGEHGRPFRLTWLNGTPIFEKVLLPGTAVIMTLEANLRTKHGVPAVDEAGSSGSIVFRTITDRVSWTQLEKNIVAAEKAKIKAHEVKETKKRRREEEAADPVRELVCEVE